MSFQNGLGNAAVLKRHLPGQQVLAGMVPFNVVNRGRGAFHQGTEGALEVERHAALAAFEGSFVAAGLPLVQHADLRPVQWAKLLLNLNNSVNALSGLPLKEQLSQRSFRRCVALAQEEALALLGRAGIRVARLTPIPPALIPKLLSVPDWLFARARQPDAGDRPAGTLLDVGGPRGQAHDGSRLAERRNRAPRPQPGPRGARQRTACSRWSVRPRRVGSAAGTGRHCWPICRRRDAPGERRLLEQRVSRLEPTSPSLAGCRRIRG